MSPGLIGHQAYPRSYLPLQPSPAPLSGTLLGIMSAWAFVCLPRSQPKFLGVEGLVGSGSTQNQKASCGKKNLGRQAPSGQWHWTGQVTMAEEGRRGWSGQQQWMSPPPYTLSLAGLPHLRALAPCALPCLSLRSDLTGLQLLLPLD